MAGTEVDAPVAVAGGAHTVAAGAPSTSGGQADPVPPEIRVSSWRLARAFGLVGLTAFGGATPLIYRMVVEKEKWVERDPFMELWTVCMPLPGPTANSIAVMIGYRFAGLRGACAALGGLLAAPLLFAIVAATLYQKFGAIPAVHGATRGIIAVAASLWLATAIKQFSAITQRRRKVITGVLALAACLGIIFGLPLIAVLGILLPVSLAIELRMGK
jgi:chromate transporter